MTYTYAILGSGRQGTAAAYDLARWGDGSHLIMADRDAAVALRAAQRLNDLLGKPVAEAATVDVTNLDAVVALLQGVDGFLSGVPYYYNLGLTQAAIRAKTHMVDLGGNTDIVRQQHGFDAQARQAGITIVPDCGQVPGVGTTLIVYAMEMLDKAVDVYMWDGGIPQNPRPPFDYLLTFHVAGLTNEYAEPGIFLRDGKITEIEPMTECETVHFPEPIGDLEAFVAGGGTSTMPWTFEGKVRTLQNLTLRYPGHYNQLRAFWDLGLWDLNPIQVGDVKVVPRDVFHALYEPKVVYPEDKDLVIVRIKALGEKDGAPAEALVELIDYYDEQTGFTAMERATGWTAAIVLAMAVHRQLPLGAGGVETFVPAAAYVEEMRRQGFNLTTQVSTASGRQHM